MVYYKIKSLTSRLPKRHQFKDATLEIEYKEKFTTKKHKLLPTGTLFISSPSLPINLHKLRMKGLITVVEISRSTFLKLQLPPPKPKKEVKVETPVETPKKTTSKKRGYKKTSSTEDTEE